MFTAYRKVFALLGLILISSSAHASLAIAFPIPNPNGETLWPKVGAVATVFYVIDSASDPNATSKIDAAITTFNADFPNVIQWVQWTNSSPSPNYVDINLSASDTSGQCEANEGYEAKPAQPMTGSTACTVGTILHEMGHVIGLWHEQSRSDAANYVTLNYNNVIKGSWSNFQPVTDNAQILGPYDYASVMQYIPYAFTRNGEAVIESIPAGIPLSGYEGVPPTQVGTSGAPAQPAFDYSAGDKETILRLYGAAPTKVTVTSNPVGLNVIVDGLTIATPQTYTWSLFSSHTLDVPAEAQTLSGFVLNSIGSKYAVSFYYTYGRWNDSTAQMHTITVAPGNGSPTFPSTAPQIATYSANFIQLVPYSASIAPTGTGQSTVSPQPQTYSGVAGQYFVARQQATLSATANTGWNFYEFNNSPFWLPGGLGANPKTFEVPDTGNPVNTTVEFSNTPIYTVDIQPETFSSNLTVYVDKKNVDHGGLFYTPKNFSSMYDSNWTPGSKHSLQVLAEQSPYSVNSRYTFSSWSDGGPMSHTTAPLPATAQSYIATVTAQFRPATNFDFPPCGGSATPNSVGFYPTGHSLRLAATPDTDWLFAGWTYDKTGTANPATLVANDETLVYANFNTVNTPLTLASLKPSSARAGAAGFMLTLTGTGFSPTSVVYANGQYRTVTYVNSKTLSVPMTSADVASAGAFQVYVENFPSGWTGCAVFGYQTFIVQGRGATTPTPVFSPSAGAYSTAQSVSISDAVPGATINYTTDGTTPTASSPVYNNSPIAVSSTETLKASASASGYVRSAVAIAKYVIKP